MSPGQNLVAPRRKAAAGQGATGPGKNVDPGGELELQWELMASEQKLVAPQLKLALLPLVAP
eukprot:m.223412 g.223412  ORF g.223412 m.223412 type:complete len:62 (+) comp79195_c0_seq1:219-404(+)